jgi:hypothetical protein
MYKNYARHQGNFLNHTGREKNFDATDGTNQVSRSKKYFRCICLINVETSLPVGRIFSISPPPPTILTKVNTLLTKKKTVLTKGQSTDGGKNSTDEG